MAKVYKVKGYKMDIYCKVTTFTNYVGDNMYTISFGGKNEFGFSEAKTLQGISDPDTEFCLVSYIHSHKPTNCYIDRVERNSACVIDGTLEEKGGTEILVELALWTIHTLFPYISIFSFKDNSHIYCQQGSKEYKLSLSYDYILKYNQTWYQNKFGAKLPDISFHKGQKSYDELFTESLKILDYPLIPFKDVGITNKTFVENENIYNTSLSPRDFINNLRVKYGKKYCFKVGEWLTQYMIQIGILLYDDSWFIDIESISEPYNFNIQETTNIIKGGNKTQKRRKTIVKNKNFRLYSYMHSIY